MIIKVCTDDGTVVDTMTVLETWGNQARGRLITGHPHGMFGWLDRALDDAAKVQRGIDPERPSEKVMRIIAERDMESAHADGMHDELPRDGCPECERTRNRV